MRPIGCKSVGDREEFAAESYGGVFARRVASGYAGDSFVISSFVMI